MQFGETNATTVIGDLRVVCQSNDVVNETLVPWLAEFTEHYPELGISIDVKESVIDVIDGDFDVFWAVGPYLGPVLQEHWWEGAEVYAYYHPSRPVQAKVRAFLDFFVAECEEWAL